MKSVSSEKIYAMTRIQISGKALLKRIKAISEEDLVRRLENHFANLPEKELTGLKKLGLKKLLKTKLFHIIEKLKKLIMKLKK